MNESRKQKQVARLIKDQVAGLILHTMPDSAGLVTVTRVEISKDLRTADVFISTFGGWNDADVMELLHTQIGSYRKVIASRTKLKYNPLLIFRIDPLPGLGARIDELISQTKKNET